MIVHWSWTNRPDLVLREIAREGGRLTGDRVDRQLLAEGPIGDEAGERRERERAGRRLADRQALRTRRRTSPPKRIACAPRSSVSTSRNFERAQPGRALEHVAERRGDAGDVDGRHDRALGAARRVDDLVGDARVVDGAAEDLLRADVQVAEEAAERPAAAAQGAAECRRPRSWCRPRRAGARRSSAPTGAASSRARGSTRPKY